MAIGSSSKITRDFLRGCLIIVLKHEKTLENGSLSLVSERGIILASIKKITEEGIDDKDEVASGYSGTAVASFL